MMQPFDRVITMDAWDAEAALVIEPMVDDEPLGGVPSR